MDTCTAIAMYANETGLLIRGLLVLLAIGMVFAWRQGRKLRRTALALQDSRRMAASAQARVRELEEVGAKFEAELLRVDDAKQKWKDGYRKKQREVEMGRDEIELAQQHIAALTEHVAVDV